MPREPVRTISTSSPRFSAALNRARATSSAPTQSAPESREMNTRALMPAPLSGERRASPHRACRPRDRDRAAPRGSYGKARGNRRPRVSRGRRGVVSPNFTPSFSSARAANASPPAAWQDSARQSLSTRRPGRLVAEVVIEGHRAVDLGAGQVERLCHHAPRRLPAHSRRRAAAHGKSAAPRPRDACSRR